MVRDMRFDNGMLGVCIVIIAIVGAIGGAYVLSMDMEEVQVTKYDYVADVTGIFDSSKTVTYVEYEPSTNFTGYYTNANTKYFDGVDYSTSTKTNNYKLNLAPLSSTNTTISLSTLTSDQPSAPNQHFALRYAVSSTDIVVCAPNYVTFTEFITQKSLGGNDLVKLSANVTTVDYSSANGGWFTFAVKSMQKNVWESIFNYNIYLFKNPAITSGVIDDPYDLWNGYDQSEWSEPILSAIWNGSMVELFYGADFTRSAGIFTPSDVLICYAATDAGTLTLSSSAKLYTVDMPDATYMDVSKGVKMES